MLSKQITKHTKRYYSKTILIKQDRSTNHISNMYNTIQKSCNMFSKSRGNEFIDNLHINNLHKIIEEIIDNRRNCSVGLENNPQFLEFIFECFKKKYDHRAGYIGCDIMHNWLYAEANFKQAQIKICINKENSTRILSLENKADLNKSERIFIESYEIVKYIE